MKRADTLAELETRLGRPLNLVDVWLWVATAGGVPQAAAVADMSADLGRRDTPAQVNAWRAGSRPIPDGVDRYMRAGALPAVVRDCRLDDGLLEDWQIERAAQLLSGPALREDRPDKRRSVTIV